MSIYTDRKDTPTICENMANRQSMIQMQLKAMNMKRCGDVFSSDASEQEATLDCIDSMIDVIKSHYDYKIKTQKEIHDLQIYNRSLEKKVNSSKSNITEELNALQAKYKGLQEQLHEKKRALASQKTDHDREISSLENRVKQLNIDNRKKEIAIQQLSDKSYAQSVKNHKFIEISGSLPQVNVYDVSDLRKAESSEVHRLREELGNLQEILYLLISSLHKVSAHRHEENPLQKLALLSSSDFKSVGVGLLRDAIQSMMEGVSPKALAQTHDGRMNNIQDVQSLYDIVGSHS